MNRSAAKTTATGTSARYSAEFKDKAVQMLLSGQTLVLVSKELGVSVPTLISWKKSHRARTEGGPIAARTGTAEEISRLRFELQKALEERDRLRKSIACLIGAGSALD
jgi:transposase-like protein